MVTTRNTERTPGPIEEEIINLSIRGYTPVQIASVLPGVVRTVSKAQRWKSAKVPHLRTIQRIARRVHPPDPSGAWQIEDSAPRDARIVLDRIAELAAGTAGRVSAVTRREADWMVRLNHAGPPLDAYMTLRIVRLYMDRRDRGTPTTDLDAFLAFAPWRGGPSLDAYVAAVKHGVMGIAAVDHLYAAMLFAGGVRHELREAGWQRLSAPDTVLRLAIEEIERLWNTQQEVEDATQA